MKYLPIYLKIILFIPLVGLFALIPLSQTLEYDFDKADTVEPYNHNEVIFAYQYLILCILNIIYLL